jgi:glycine C-acetyltransferase
MATETGGGILFITEGVLVCADNRVNKEIVALKEKYLRLLVDDAHGFGTLGKQELEQVRSKIVRWY